MLQRTIFLLAVFLLLFGCVLPESVKLGDEALQQQDYYLAVQHYEKALSETQDSYTRQQIEQKLAPARKLLIDSYLAKAGAARANTTNGSVAAINHAIAILDEVLQWDDGTQRLARQQDLYHKEKEQIIAEVSSLLTSSSELIRQFNFQDALSEIKKGLAFNSANKGLINRQRTLEKMIPRYEAFLAALNRNNLQAAIDEYDLLVKKSPEKLNFANLPERQKVITLIEQEAGRLQEQQRWWQAYTYLTRWQIPQLSPYVTRIKNVGATFYYDRAREAMKAGQPHKGFLLIERAISLNSTSLGIFNLSRELGDLVNKSMQSNIAIASFDAPSNDPDAGKQFSDSLISYLYEVLPYGINILERDKIDYILKEKVDGEKELAQILGVDLMVTGTVSLFKVDKVVDERTATVKVKSGEHMVPNPEYAQFLKTYGTDRLTWPEEPPPSTITQDVYELVKYTKGTAELKGFAKVSVRIFDTQKGAIAFVRDYDANVNYSSDFQDELSEAGIEYIPMKLPSETEAKEEMRKEIVQQIGKIVQSSFEKRETRFLNQAKFYLERRQDNLAYVPLAEGYLYCSKEGLSPDNPAFMEIKRLIDTVLN